MKDSFGIYRRHHPSFGIYKVPYFLLDSGAAAVAYSLRYLNNSFVGNDVITVRRSSDNAEQGFTPKEIINGTLENWVNESTALPLDTADAAAAYSLRNLKTSYTGSVIRVRRSVDNAESDFTADEITDGTLLAWVGNTASDNGFVTTWYDQSGNSNDATQGTAANQPKIVNAGSTITDGGKPSILINQSISKGLLIPIAASSRQDFFQVHKTNDDGLIVFKDSLSTLRYAYAAQDGNTSTTLHSNYGTPSLYVNSSTESPVTRDDLHTLLSTNSQVLMTSLDGDSSQFTGGIRWGYYSSAFIYDGNVQEIIFYNSDQSSNRTSIETNINDYYNIYAQDRNGFVTTWYDQSGNSNDAVQNTATSQPKIVDAGVLVEENGKPAILPDGVDDILIGNISNVSYQSIFVVGKPATSALNHILLEAGPYFAWNATQVIYRTNTFNPHSFPSDSTQGLVSVIAEGESDPRSVNAYRDGIASTNNPISLNLGQDVMRIFGASGSVDYDSPIQEIIIFDTDQSSNRVDIETNINNYYAMYAGSPVGGLLYNYPSSAAAYSLRQLTIYNNGYKETVVRVRRDSDNAEEDFTADEITEGMLLAWVNTDVVKRDDDYSLSDTWSELGGTGAFNQSIGGRSGLYQYAYSGGATTHQAFQASNHPDNSLQYKITFDIYFDVAQDCNGFSYLKPDGTSDTQHNLTKGVWHSFTYTTLGGSNLSRFIPSVNGASGTNNDGSGFYLSSFVVEQLTANGHVTTWYDQSGNSNDATQATAANQPKIINAGSLITSNGYTVIEYDGTDDNLTTSLTATGTMLMGGSDGSAFYEVDINGSYSLLANASLTDHPLNESIRVIWSSSLTTAQKTAIESLITYTDWNFADVTDFTQYWRQRSELTDFPLIDTSNSTSFVNAWYGCNSLTSFPALDVSSGTTFFYAWNACSSLTSFPLLDVSNGTNFSAAWRSCTLLTSFPLLDVSNSTNFSDAWRNCTSLTSFPLLNVSSGTNFTSAWNNCTSLTSFPALDVSNGTNFEFAWMVCSSLTSFPLLNVSSGNNFVGTWRLCTSLTSFPLLDVSNGTNFQQAWQLCTSLQDFPANMFDSVTATNFTQAFTSTNLTQTSIDNILTSIDTANTSNGTFDQSGGSAPSATGEAAIDNLIARGWTITVTGGYQTYSTYKYRVETDGGTLYASRACTETAINNLKAL